MINTEAPARGSFCLLPKIKEVFLLEPMEETIQLQGYDNSFIEVNKSVLEKIVRKEYDSTLGYFLSNYVWDDTENIARILSELP